MSWTKLAEGYPQRLAAYLAKEMAESLKPIARRRSLDPAACARAGHRRIGEAGNPGPRPARARPEVDLDDVALVQASTLAIQARAQRMFLDWLQAELTPETWESIRNSPELQLVFLRAFGSWAYQEGPPNVSFSTPDSFLSAAVSRSKASCHSRLGASRKMGSWCNLRAIDRRCQRFCWTHLSGEP